MKDKKEIERIEDLEYRLTRAERHIDDYASYINQNLGKVNVPTRNPAAAWKLQEPITIKEAVQHIINCLNITYSPDKFNHE